MGDKGSGKIENIQQISEKVIDNSSNSENKN